MSITDELRSVAAKTECANGRCEKLYRVDLERIADRIDAEHQKAIRELNILADASVLLPVDADGERIHVGDVMEWPTTNETFEVVGIGNGTLFYVEDGNEKADWTGASTKRHYHAPTVEDVLREFVTEFNRDDSELCDGEIIERFAAKLQLKEDE